MAKAIALSRHFAPQITADIARAAIALGCGVALIMAGAPLPF